MNPFERKPPIGTPENPEIIEPGEQPPPPRGRAQSVGAPPQAGLFLRLRLSGKLISGLLLVCLPAIASIWVSVNLLQASGEGHWAATILLLIMAIPTLALSFAAVLGSFVILVSLIMVWRGRPLTLGSPMKFAFRRWP